VRGMKPARSSAPHQRAEDLMDRAKHDRSDERTPKREPDTPDPNDAPLDDVEANPPRTTTGPITSPKFGSAGSGGAELEPGPPRP